MEEMEWNEIEARKLDALQDALWDKAVAGDLRAILGILKIIETRARLSKIRPISKKISTEQENNPINSSPSSDIDQETLDHAVRILEENDGFGEEG